MPADEDTWKPWRTHVSIEDLAGILEATLESNDFSTIEVGESYISPGLIIRAAKRDVMSDNYYDFVFHDVSPFYVPACKLCWQTTKVS